MDARRYGPIAGTVAMFATIWFIDSTSLLAQYGAPQFAPAQFGPMQYGPAPIIQGYGQASQQE